jgi:DNA-binding winged helix-turn-helix (wHTH) protein
MENNKVPEVVNFTIGDFTILTSRNLITDGNTETVITPKMLSVLSELAKHQGKTLSKEHLILAVWGTVHTSDMVLSRAISDLRKVFSDSARQQLYIETVSKQGYRLKKEVIWIDSSSVSQTPIATEPESTSQLGSPKKTSMKPWYKSTKYKLFFAFFFAVILLGILFISQVFTDKSNSTLLESKMTTITSGEGSKNHVRFSPDGKYLVYSVDSPELNGMKLHLYSLDDDKTRILDKVQELPDGSEVTPYQLAPTFSPDGSQIAYKGYNGEGCHIVIINLSDLSQDELSDCPNSKTEALDWSSDGKYIVSTVFNSIKNIESLTLINTVSGNMEVLPSSQSKASGYFWPRFSPDNKKIAVVYFRPNSHLWTIGLVDTKSGEFAEILTLNEEVSQVLWDETGDFLYYLVVNVTDGGIRKVNISTKHTQQIVNIKASSLDFDEVSQQFAFIERERIFSIWQSYQNVMGEVTTSPTFEHFYQTHSPSLSPDNNTLAFISTASGRDDVV